MTFHHRHLSHRHLLILGMVVPTLLFLLVGGLQWKSGDDLRKSRNSVTHIRTVLLDLETLLTCVLNAETGQRGYLLLHEDSYLQPYHDSLASINDQVNTLRQLMRNSDQQNNLASLDFLIKAKFDELGQTIAADQGGDHLLALQLMSTNSGKDTMDKIRAAVHVMQDGETNLYLQQEDAYERSSKINFELSILFLALSLGFIIALVFLFALRRLEQMQEMITICSWSKLIEYEGEWLTVEQYLARRLQARVTHGISHGETYKMLKLLEYEKLKKKPAAGKVAASPA